MQKTYNESFAIYNTFEHALSINPINQSPTCKNIFLRIFHDQTHTDTRISIIYHPQFHAFSLYNHKERNILNDSYNNAIFQHIGIKRGFLSIADLENAIREVFPNIYLPITIIYATKDIANPHICVQYDEMNGEELEIFQLNIRDSLPEYIGKYRDVYTHIIPQVTLPTQAFSLDTPLAQIHQAMLHQCSIITQNFSIHPSDKLHINYIEHFLPPIHCGNEHIHLSICAFTPPNESTPIPSNDSVIWYQLYVNNEKKCFDPIAYKDKSHQQDDKDILHDIYAHAINSIQHMTKKWSGHTHIFFLRALQQQLQEQHEYIIPHIQRICDILHHQYIYTHFPAKYPKA